MSDDAPRCRCGCWLTQDVCGTRCSMKCAWDTERREFIRETAARLAPQTIYDADGNRCATAADAWTVARELWDAKPDDC